MQLNEIIEYWSYRNRPIPDSIPRKVSLPTYLDPKIDTVIQGVRRSGKSTLLTQFIPHFRLDKERCLFINFEDPRLITQLNITLLDELVEFFSAQYGKNEPLYYFFDEIQNVPHWQKWIHTRLERPSRDHFIVTGSSAKLLSRELGSSLTGRHFLTTLFPFSMQERLASDSSISCDRFIREGGFPAAISNPDSGQMLRQYFNDIVEKDVLARLGISNPQSLRQLVKIIFESTGSETSFRKLAGATGLSADTVASYIAHVEDAYLFLSCPFFSFSEKQRIRRNNKYYPIDSALRRAVASSTGDDLGKDFELVVFLALKRLFSEVYYWKGSGEVDFVIQSRNGILPIQVSIDSPKPRHLKALEEFHSEFPDAKPEILCHPDNFVAVIEELEGMLLE